MKTRERGNMNDLVYLKRNDAFTDSMVIAEGTKNQHHTITRILRKYPKDFGKMEFMDLKSINPKGGRPTKVYLLNEEQATLLITYLDNTEVVREFKKKLVHQFFEMRKFIAEKQTTTWLETRQQGKLTRKAETDVIQKLVEYAESQGSGHADMLYMTYSKLANKYAGVDKRDNATVMQLNNLSLMEHIILNVIQNGITAGMYYKEIYKASKARLESMKDIAFLESAS